MPNYGYSIERERPAEIAASATDPRLLRSLVFDPPPEIDPRAWHRIENQGSMGSCQGHALSSVCELAFHIATGQVTQFSPLFAYYASQQIDGLLGRDVGSTLAGGLKVAQQFGMCPLDAMPYPNPVRYTGIIPANAWPLAVPFKIRSHTVCQSYADVFQFLASAQGGVELGIAWGNAMTPDARGVIERFSPGSGGHAIAFLGYSRRRDQQNRAYLWLANSWSPTWGQAGWAEVAPQAVDQMFQHPQTVMLGLSDLSTPQPRRVNWRKESVFQ